MFFYLIFLLVNILPFPDILTRPELCKEESAKIKTLPDSPDKSVEAFLILMCAGQEEGAEKLLKAADDKFPENFLIKFNLGNLYVKKGRYDLAIFYLNQAKKLSPNNLQAYESLASAYMRYGDTKSAAKIIDEAVKIMKEGKTEEKNAKSNKETELDNKKLTQLLLKKGFIHLIMSDETDKEDMRKKFLDEAAESFKDSLKIHPSPHAYVGLAETLKLKGEIEEAVKYAFEISKVAYEPIFFLYAGALVHESGFTEEAIPLYTIAAERFKTNEMYIAKLMLSVVKRDLGFYTEARQNLEEVIGKFPETSTAKLPYSATERIKLSRRFIEMGNIKGAEHEIRDILRFSPNNQEARKLLVDILILKALIFADKKIENFEEANNVAKKYLEEFPSDDEMLYKLALVSFWLAEVGPKYARSGNLLHAISALQSAIRVKQKDEYLELLGICYYLLEKYDSAAEELEKVKEKDDYIIFLLTSSYMKMGDVKKAKQTLLKAKNTTTLSFKTLLYEVLKGEKADVTKILAVEEAILEEKEIQPNLIQEKRTKDN